MGEPDPALLDLRKRARIRALRRAAGPEFLFMGFASDEAKAIAREFQPPANATPADAPADQSLGAPPPAGAAPPVGTGAKEPPPTDPRA